MDTQVEAPESPPARTPGLRALLIVCAVAFVTLCIGVAIGARALLTSYARVESGQVAQNATQVYRALDADLHQLAISNRDYAEWDDAEEFARKRDLSFIEHNFSADSLGGMFVDVVWLTDASGRDVYSGLLDRATQKITSPAPPFVLEPLRRVTREYRRLEKLDPASRILQTPAGLAAVSALEIKRSDRTSPSGVVMLFARFIQAAEVDRMRQTAHMPVSMLALSRDTQRVQALPPAVRFWAMGRGPGADTFVQPMDDREIAGYARVRDIDGRPVAIFTTAEPREIYSLGRQMALTLLGSNAVLIVAFGLALAFLMIRLERSLVAKHAADRALLDQQRSAEDRERATRRKLKRMAQFDSLTGLPNRAYLHARLPAVLEKVGASERLLALLYLDIDHFKNINDSRGHACGDQLLQIVGRRLRAAVAAEDVVVRMGGDEFVIIAALLPDRDSMEAIAMRVQSAINASMVINGEELRVSASIGIATYPDGGACAETLLKHADIALYHAKESGRRCYRFFSADMNLRISEHMALEQALRHAVGTDQIHMQYQPIVDLRDGKVVSLEALMRWRHPERGLIPPLQFIPVAESTGLIAELGQQALRIVAKQLRSWQDQNVALVPIAVNVSALQFDEEDFASLVGDVCHEVGIDPQWLRFEITESAVMKKPEKLVETLQALRKRGSKVLIDDFGTGYSSLSYLNRLPADTLKIDRAFVRDLGKSAESPIIDAVLDIARKLNLTTVAEGVETPEQAALLLEQGCNYAQGYYFSTPVGADACRELLERARTHALPRVTSEATALVA